VTEEEEEEERRRRRRREWKGCRSGRRRHGFAASPCWGEGIDRGEERGGSLRVWGEVTMGNFFGSVGERRWTGERGERGEK
jgi:hypothetical protein